MKKVALLYMQMTAVDALSGCLVSNRFPINPTKTQFIWLSSRRRLSNVDRFSVTKTFPHLVLCDTVRDLGIILDQELNFSVGLHINQVTRSCYYVYQLHQLRILFLVPYLVNGPCFCYWSAVGR